jgi:ribosomal protein S18 acetylase RimI-like enzyme
MAAEGGVGSWKVRRAAPEDAEAVSEAFLAAAVAAWSGFLGQARIESALARSQHRADLVAEDKEGVFGFVAWDEGSAEVTRIYTHPRGQGRGAGRKLLEGAERALRGAGADEAWLHTEKRNQAAIRFYERCGWREQGPPRIRDWHGTRLVEPRFAKRLGKSA